MKKKKLIIFSILILSACATVPTRTSTPNETLNSIPTQTATIPSTKTPELTKEQQAKLDEVNQLLSGSFVISEDGNINNLAGDVVKGLFYDLDSGLIRLQVGQEIAVLTPSQISLNADGSVHVIGYEMDAATQEWKEIMKFPVANIENFRDCKITEDDIVSGRIDKWLETLSQPFDLSKIRLDVPLIIADEWGEIIYDDYTAPNFLVEGSGPFHRDTTACHLQIERDGKVLDYMFLPQEMYDKATGKSYWVKLIQPLYDLNYEFDETHEDFNIDAFSSGQTFTPIVIKPYNPFSELVDPLVSETFAKYPDLDSRFSDFVSGKDMSVLSNSDMIFLTNIKETDADWWK